MLKLVAITANSQFQCAVGSEIREKPTAKKNARRGYSTSVLLKERKQNLTLIVVPGVAPFIPHVEELFHQAVSFPLLA